MNYQLSVISYQLSVIIISSNRDTLNLKFPFTRAVVDLSPWVASYPKPENIISVISTSSSRDT